MPALRRSYTYSTLPQGDVFRYLVLQPGVKDDPLVCNLQTDAISNAEYDAVSYVWGTSVRDHHIKCDDHDLMITEALSKVLKRVRLPDKPRALWADSICINQDNPQDKGHQVGLMGKIYRFAKSVLIYIGSDDDSHGPAVISLLEDVNQMIEDTCQQIDMSWNSFPEDSAEETPFWRDPRWNSLHVFVSQSWFDRAWVVQEAALAHRAQVIWGQSLLEWEKLMRLYIWFTTRGGQIYYGKGFDSVQINAHLDVYLETHKDFGRAFYTQMSWGKLSILRTLNCAKELDVSNQRDRIYAFMALPQVAEQLVQIQLRPDYFAPYLKTYHRFAEEYIRASGSTELLDYVSHDEESLISGTASWVPRWDICTWSLSPSSSASSGIRSRTFSTPEPLITESELLKVRGVVVDIVHYASDVFDWDTTTSESLKSVWDTVMLAQTDSPYGSLSYRLDAFLDALSSGIYDGERSQWRRARQRFRVEVLLKQNPGDRQHSKGDSIMAETDDTIDLYFDKVRSRVHNRRIVLTQRGYLGLAPLPAREGDSCALIFGCAKPCLLRKAEQDLSYQLIGATTLIGKDWYEEEDGGVSFMDTLGEDDSREWVDWDVEEQDIYLC
ncbi:hypothetical protein HBI56_118160 [Parastagonospora nodorum]|uniref:Heterokaryon incompatibility domain-containing protein n=2 Tax=Phaeosphaeria nodorum (strain SN15 / ATCC MYA-4574 / FGSC 10173) TaxID=321614 RepID=A0A7U2FBZ9_PHANO|nr:hypothetical protein SNOG_05433 [Parastagonospora nodorum SN15]KAH3917415.1 hypothetical protein HBH56_056610 [Parastagonospora nodorum]EAT87824.1 hypothetical protein SNOG_05433 [Parastagonospora nodorum SN15]KAH3921098.1 hypothetical protein HBH54_245640 [Parastagonospora nodorum]KAH3956408.1 hypothetical protein HBH51_242040 [Parastagonospora nodorum]KAH4037548.1 hypothetical protein HBI09_071990 [Parastagonospora nodorum]